MFYFQFNDCFVKDYDYIFIYFEVGLCRMIMNNKYLACCTYRNSLKEQFNSDWIDEFTANPRAIFEISCLLKSTVKTPFEKSWFSFELHDYSNRNIVLFLLDVLKAALETFLQNTALKISEQPQLKGNKKIWKMSIWFLRLTSIAWQRRQPPTWRSRCPSPSSHCNRDPCFRLHPPPPRIPRSGHHGDSSSSVWGRRGPPGGRWRERWLIDWTKPAKSGNRRWRRVR